jgi:hypothetical protein
MFGDLPDAFLAEYKNPCWHDANGTAAGAGAAPGRLRCLPYYFILGDFHCGVRDLHARLLQARPALARLRSARALRFASGLREGAGRSASRRAACRVSHATPLPLTACYVRARLRCPLPCTRIAASASGLLFQRRTALVGRKQAVERLPAHLRQARSAEAERHKRHVA